MSHFGELLKKYNVPAPRYTSYPTVPYWNEVPTTDQWILSLSKSLIENHEHGAALYVHIPFCKALCTYCGCNTRISRNPKVGQPYIQTILKEFKIYRERLSGTPIRVSDLHLGGGTPTFLAPEELKILVEGILEHTSVTHRHEFSIEVDPRVTTNEHLKMLASLGFRRVSMGIQDFDETVQTSVNRVQSVEQVRSLSEYAREVGFTSINYDLIYGLPHQTLKTVSETMNAVIELKPDRIAYYSYAHVPWIKPAHRKFTEADLPTADVKRNLYEIGRETLEQSGYLEIGMDHFALESDSLWKAMEAGALHRNFMGYLPKKVMPLLGLGVSSISDTWDTFIQNEKQLEKYQARVEAGELPLLRGHRLTTEDQVLRLHILNLMTKFSTSWSTEGLRVDHLKNVSKALTELTEDGLVVLEQFKCDVPKQGRAFLRNICMAFDARLHSKRLLQKPEEVKVEFSKTI